MAIIRYTESGKERKIYPAPQMFISNSPTRQLLRSRGVDFANDAEVLAWIIAKDVPSGTAYTVEGN